MSRYDVRHFKKSILLFLLVSSGCATSMQMPSAELRQLTPSEGIIVGSLQIEGGKDLLGRKEWMLFAERVKGPLSSLVSGGHEYSLRASRGGAEEVFAAKMEAGEYRFWKLEQPGFSTFTAKTNVHFRVHPGKTTYVGRLVLQFPPKFVAVGTRIGAVVEDARASTLEGARQKYGLISDEVITDLMRVAK